MIFQKDTKYYISYMYIKLLYLKDLIEVLELSNFNEIKRLMISTINKIDSFSDFYYAWLPINDEDDFPKDNDDYWILLESKKMVIGKNLNHKRIFITTEGDEIEYRFVSHYQFILKPKTNKNGNTSI